MPDNDNVVTFRRFDRPKSTAGTGSNWKSTSCTKGERPAKAGET